MSGYLADIRSRYGTDIWCDTPNVADLSRMVGLGACGATSNPVLVLRTATSDEARWKAEVSSCKADGGLPNWCLTRKIVKEASEFLRPLYDQSDGKLGIICIQVDPREWNNCEAMVAMAREAAAVGPNVAVKVPATRAGIVAVEELAALGINCTATVSYTVPQVIAIAEAFRRGKARAEANGMLKSGKPLHSYAVLMVGRLDDHLRDVVKEQSLSVDPELLTKAGNAVGKKAYRIYKERGYQSRLLIAAMRGNYHIDQYVGADLTVTTPPANEMELGKAYGQKAPPPRIDEPIPQSAIDELSERFVDFRRAYAEDGMQPADFDSFGPCVKTLNQFTRAWEGLIELVG